MSIRKITLLVAVVLALSFVSMMSFRLYDLYHSKTSAIDTQLSMRAASLLNKTIIELSLERSVMQVTLNLDNPIEPAFADLLNGQREKSDAGFEEVVAMVGQSGAFRRADVFLETILELRGEVGEIRRQADESLAKPLADRNADWVQTLPERMKSAILAFSVQPLKLRPEGSTVSTLVTALEKIQHNAWAVREYGGRERTYLAIATATGRTFSDMALREMAEYHARATAAMTELDLLSDYVGLSAVLVDNIEAVRGVYFGAYDQTRAAIFDAATRGAAYPISFETFFTESSTALDTAVTLSYLAGDEMEAAVEQSGDAATTQFWVIAGALLFVIGLCGFQIYVTQFRVSNRLLSLSDAMAKLTRGETDIDLSGLQSGDEIGRMAGHVDVFRSNAIEVRRLAQEQEKQQEEVAAEKVRASTELANSFEERVGVFIERFQAASSEVQDMSMLLSQAMTTASAQSQSVAVASQAASTSVQTVAAGAEEMSASIQEISRNVTDTAQKARRCAGAAQTSQEKLGNLSRAVEEIDTVIRAINDVAEQTSLLALNATIEAARAGESGRGFAVVASEVKSLANETHKMTGEISSKVEDIKNSASQTIDSVNDIINQISAVDQKTASVASAIAQQSTTTSEISESAQSAANGTGDVSRNIEVVQKSTKDSARSTESLKAAADGLLGQASSLKSAVDDFLNEVRAA